MPFKLLRVRAVRIQRTLELRTRGEKATNKQKQTNTKTPKKETR